jgi:hypothetical protein
MESLKPLILSWRELAEVMSPLHLWEKGDVDALHDIWKFGAPSPQSRILVLKNYDERKAQAGNFEARIIFPKMLTKWIIDVAFKRGIAMTEMQAIALTQGHVI